MANYQNNIILCFVNDFQTVGINSLRELCVWNAALIIKGESLNYTLNIQLIKPQKSNLCGAKT